MTMIKNRSCGFGFGCGGEELSYTRARVKGQSVIQPSVGRLSVAREDIGITDYITLCLGYQLVTLIKEHTICCRIHNISIFPADIP